MKGDIHSSLQRYMKMSRSLLCFGALLISAHLMNSRPAGELNDPVFGELTASEGRQIKQWLEGKEFFSSSEKEWVQNCRKESGFAGDIGVLNYTDASSVPKSLKCYMACFIGKQRLMKPNGSIDFNYTKEHYSTIYKGKENVTQLFHGIVDGCAKEYKEYPDKCETAFQYLSCERTSMATIVIAAAIAEALQALFSSLTEALG